MLFPVAMATRPFLHEAIASPVKRVFEDKRSCELDPTRKGSDGNLGVLIEHVIAVMNGIKAAAPNCPPELKVCGKERKERVPCGGTD